MTNTLGCRTRLILALGLLVSPVVLGAEIIEQILVKVNGEIFTKTDLEMRQVQAMRQRGIQLDPKDPTDAQLRQALNTVTPQVMVEAVSEMLLVQRAKELGYKLADEQFKQIVDNIRKENKLDTDEKFQAALKQENMTVADLRRQVERSILVQRVESVEVFGKVAITEDEARRYYDAHLDGFTTPAAVTLREILVAVPADKADDAAQDAAARAKAEEIRARAVAGENYMKLAEDSSDAPSKANAGLIGPISLSDLSPELRKVIEPMKNGEVSPVIRTPRGYQIFKVETLSASQTTPFEQAREQISDRIVTGKRKDEFDKYLARLRAQAIIEWKNPDVKKAFEEGLAEQAKAGHAAPLSRDAGCLQTPSQWFAIWTRSRHEQVVREQLERKQFEAFLPTIPKWSRWKDRKKKIDWPLFPGYCFARFDPADTLAILKCAGVVNIVSFEGKPAPIPEYELDSIRVLVGSDLQYDPSPMIREGMMVEVVHGPLARRDWTAAAQGREEGEPRALRRFDRSGRVGRSRCG